MDPIISRFKDLEVGNARLHDEDKDPAAVIRKIMENGNVYGEALKQCEAALQCYSDLLKLEFVTTKSWYITALYESVLIRFGMKLEEAGGVVRGEEFYKDLALKSMKKCDKSAVGLESLYDQVASVRDYILECTENLQNVAPLLSDSYTLLLELWIVTNREIRHFQKVIAGIFMRSKLLLIDHELTRIRDTIHQNENKENAEKLQNTILSYRSFLKIFLAQLHDAEESTCSESNQDAFDECLKVFFDVESMYQALNFSRLNKENYELKETNRILEEKATSSLPTIDEATETGAMTSFVEQYLDHTADLSFSQHVPSSRDGKSNSAMSSVSSASSSYTFSPTTKSYHSLSTSSYDDNSPYLDYNNLSDKDRPIAATKFSTASSSTLQNTELRTDGHFNDREFKNKDLDGDTESELYMLMEKTNLSKELPKLLNAFNNAKKLEQELKTVSETTNNSNKSSQENLPIEVSDVSSKDSRLSNSQILPRSMVHNNLLDKKKEDLRHNMDFWFNPKRSSNLPIGYNNPLFAKLNTSSSMQMGFKSDFLNNLYGLHQAYEKK